VNEFPRLLPNGKGIVVASSGELLLEDIERHVVRRLASDEGLKAYPVLSFDGTRVIYRTPAGFRIVDVDEREGRPRPLSGTGANDFPTGSVSRDGTFPFVRVSPSTSGDVYLMSLSGGEPRAILKSRSYEGGLHYSPDGRLVVYASDETGQMEVYVAPASDLHAKTSVSAPGGGTQPLWSRSGRELFYRRSSEMSVVTVSAACDALRLSNDPSLVRTPVRVWDGSDPSQLRRGPR
jgi:Tol biopolymer transport system component